MVCTVEGYWHYGGYRLVLQLSLLVWDQIFWCPVWELKLVVSLCCNFGSLIVVWRNCFSLLRRQGSITVHVWTVLPIYISLVCHPVCCPVNVGGHRRLDGVAHHVCTSWAAVRNMWSFISTASAACISTDCCVVQACWRQRLDTRFVAVVFNWRLINCRGTYIGDALYRKWPWPFRNFISPAFLKAPGT